MQKLNLKAVKREKTGKQYAKEIRKRKMIPGVVYGKNLEPISLEVNAKDLETLLKTGSGENALINLSIEGESKNAENTVLIHDLQMHPVQDFVEHVDFHVISLSEKIHVKVPVHEKGEAPGVKEGGVLDHSHRELEVECLPTEIPERIDVSIEGLKIGDGVHVKDITFPSGVNCLLDPDEVILTILAPRVEEVAEVEEEQPETPELIRKEKEEGSEGEGAAPTESK